MPLKASAAAVAAPYTWSGLYFGGHFGGARSHSSGSDTSLPSTAFANQPNLAYDNGDRSFVGGLQLGYNWHLTPQWMLGIEADMSWTGLSGSQTYAPVPVIIGAPAVGSNESLSADVDWIGTVRGRLGYAWDRSLLYVTGGYAYSKINYNALGQWPGIPTTFRYAYSSDSIRSGWTIGGGYELALPMLQNWTVRAEYLYYKLDGAAGTTFGVPSTAPIGSLFAWEDMQIHTVRVGLNYRF
jgi:outer membrane immunogenic protein